MKDDKKNEMRRHYAQLLGVQARLRALVATSGLEVELAPDPGEPVSVDQLADAMNVVRDNTNIVQCALDNWDRQVNGCETRTRALIMNDIDHDEMLLAKKESDGSARTREQIELNISYDHMQLRRI